MSILFGTASVLTVGYLAYKDVNKTRIERRKEKRKFIDKFQQFMKAVNKENKLEQTYEVLKYIDKNYGNDAIVGVPIGYNVKTLIDLIPSLEIIYRANIIIETSSEKNSAYMRVHYMDSDIKQEDEIRFNWYKCMNNIDKARNSVYETFNIKSIKEIKDFNDEKCGYELNINVPNGLDHSKIISNSTTIKDSLDAKRIFINYNQENNFIIAKLIYIPISDDLKFKPIKTQSVTEMYFGTCYDYVPATGDFKELAHALITGRTGSGKTVSVQTALTNHIYWYPKNEWELYLAQLSDKKDVGIFKDVEQCRYYADDIIKVYKLLSYLKSIQKQRNVLFEQYYNSTDKYISSIYSYNKLNPFKKLKQIFLWSDEFSCYQPRANDTEDVVDLKQKCLAILTSLFQEGRSVGIHVIGTLQRPDKNNLDPQLKAQIGIKICFHQPNTASSLVVLDTTEACDLRKTREAIVESEDRYLMKTLWLTEEDIEKWIKKRIDKSHKNYIDLDNADNSNSNESNTQTQETGNENQHGKKQRDRHKKYMDKKKDENNDKSTRRKLPSCVIRK